MTAEPATAPDLTPHRDDRTTAWRLRRSARWAWPSSASRPSVASRSGCSTTPTSSTDRCTRASARRRPPPARRWPCARPTGSPRPTARTTTSSPSCCSRPRPRTSTPSPPTTVTEAHGRPGAAHAGRDHGSRAGPLPRPRRLDAPLGPRGRRHDHAPSSAVASRRRAATRWPRSCAAAATWAWPRSATAPRQIGAFHETAALARAWDLPLILLLENNQYSVATTRQGDGRLHASWRCGRAAMTCPPWSSTAWTPSPRWRPWPRLASMPCRARTHPRGGHHLSLLPPERPPPRLRLQVPHQGRGARVEGQGPRGRLPAAAHRDRPAERRRGRPRAGPGQRARVALRGGADRRDRGWTGHPAGAVSAGRGHVTAACSDRACRSCPPERLDETPAADGEPITYTEAIQGVIGRSLETRSRGHLPGRGGRPSRRRRHGPDQGRRGHRARAGALHAHLRERLQPARHSVQRSRACTRSSSSCIPTSRSKHADQLFNHIAKSRYMYGGDHEVPVIARTQISRGRGYGPQHSCDPAALFASYPGWRVVSPTTPADYVGCWNAAMLSRDPVLVLDDHRLAKTTGVLPAAGFDHVCRDRPRSPGAAWQGRDGGDLGRRRVAGDGACGGPRRARHRGRDHRSTLAGPRLVRP